MSLRRARDPRPLALALLAATAAAASPEPGSPREEAFRTALLERAADAGRPEIATAVTVLARGGFLPQVLRAAEDADRAQGVDPAIARALRAQEGAVARWLEDFPYFERFRYAGHRVVSNRWAPGVARARLRVLLSLRDTDVNRRFPYRVDVTLNATTLQVESWDLEAEE